MLQTHQLIKTVEANTMATSRKDILFTNQADSPESFPDPRAPRNPITEYVLAELPLDLAAIQEGTINYVDLATKHAVLLDGIAPTIEANTDEQAATVMQMDLAFMLGGYLPIGSAKAYDPGVEYTGPNAYEVAPPQLLTLLELQANRFELPRRMDYELIIDVNSAEYHRTGTMRTFLTGEDALGERDFYQGHSEAEVFIKEAAAQLGALIDNPELPNKAEILRAAAANVRILDKYMRKYQDNNGQGFKNSVFDAMRPYLASYPDGIRNASGAFMPSVQLAELALHAPSEQYDKQLDESMPYFPRWARAIMPQLREDSRSGRNLEDMVKSGELQLTDEEQQLLGSIVDQFIGFRKSHLSVVRTKNIPIPDKPASIPGFQAFGEPDVMEAGGAHGTADFNILNLLAGSTHRLVDLRRKLQESRAQRATTGDTDS